MAQDPIDEFIALPRDQQMSTLQQLAPEKQEKLLGEVKTRRTKTDFGAGPKNTEGLYQMQGPNGNFTGVPYSKVMTASGAGWKIKPEDRERFAADRLTALKKKIEGPAQPWYQQLMPGQLRRPTMTEGDFRSQGPLPEAAPAKPGWWQRTEARVQSATEPTTMFPGMPAGQYDPATGEMALNTIKRAGRVLFGVADFGPQAWGALKDALSADPDKATDGETRLLDMHPGAQIVNRLRELRSDWHRDPKLAVSNVGGDVLGMWLAGKAMEGAGKALKTPGALKQKFVARYGPRSVELAGQKVPVLVGEAEPTTGPGRRQIGLKKGGVGGAKFDAVSRAQQAAVKNVIRRTAQQTSGLIGPMAAEPGAAMTDAAEATFAQARPMYAALDKSLATIPDDLQSVSKITQQAMARAEKLGITFGDENVDLSKIRPDKDGSIQWGGTRISKATHPERWNALVKEGIIDESGNGTPLSAYIKVRSELLKMKRSTADAAARNAIANEVRAMNDNMEATLKGTPLYENWTEANRLWSKGYALRDVAEAITKSTRGTPAAQQASGLAPVETRIQGPSLVNRLNGLQEEGILDKAFTPAEAANLRQAIDILDRARAQAATGSSFMHGYSPRSVIWRAIIKLPTLPLVNAMTKLDGLEALKAADAAKTSGELSHALSTLARIAAASSIGQQPPKTRKEALDLANSAGIGP